MAMPVRSVLIAIVIRVWQRLLKILTPVLTGCLNAEHEEPHQLEEAILGLIASMDKPGSPAGAGHYCLLLMSLYIRTYTCGAQAITCTFTCCNSG